MTEARYTTINNGELVLVVTNSRSKTFKTLKGALNWIERNGYKAVEVK